MLSDERNVELLIAAWKLLVGRLPGSSIQHRDGVATMLGNVPLPFFNLSMPDSPLVTEQQLHSALRITKQRVSNYPHPSLVGLFTPWVPDGWAKVAAEEGLEPEMNLTSMTADRLRQPRRVPPPLEYRRILDDSTARDLATVNERAYDLPAGMCDCLCNLNLWHEDSLGYVGYENGRAVTAAGAFPVAGTIYIAFVATLPEAHNKGFAEAVMRKTIQASEQAMGEKLLTLHASDIGKPLYESMGFESGSTITLLAQAGSASH